VPDLKLATGWQDGLRLIRESNEARTPAKQSPGGRGSSHLVAGLYAPALGVKVPPHEYMGAPPSGRSTLTPRAYAEEASHEVRRAQACESLATPQDYERQKMP
jgi:hypothetical protein